MEKSLLWIVNGAIEISLQMLQNFVNQVNWDLVSQNKESIAYIRSLINLKTSLPVLGLESYDKSTNKSLSNLQLIPVPCHL